MNFHLEALDKKIGTINQNAYDEIKWQAENIDLMKATISPESIKGHYRKSRKVGRLKNSSILDQALIKKLTSSPDDGPDARLFSEASLNVLDEQDEIEQEIESIDRKFSEEMEAVIRELRESYELDFEELGSELNLFRTRGGIPGCHRGHEGGSGG